MNPSGSPRRQRSSSPNNEKHTMPSKPPVIYSIKNVTNKKDVSPNELLKESRENTL